MQILKHYINGRWVDGVDHFTWHNPSTTEAIHSVPVANDRIVDLAVSAASDAKMAWASLPVSERAKYVSSMSQWLQNHYGEEGKETPIKRRIIDCVGKPLPESDIEVIETSDFLGYFAKEGERQLSTPEVLALDQVLWGTKKSKVVWEPHGVVALIKPWNYPLELIAWSLGPALVGGNTVVIKPSEKSADIGAIYGEMSDEIGLPPGVVNIVFGAGSTGSALVSHSKVNYVSFTGSVAVGKSVAVACANRLGKYTLELGGNDAAIVMPDTDIELAANGLVWGAFCNAGQVCVGTKRAFVHSDIYDKLAELVCSKVKTLRLGVDVGPIIDAGEREKVSNFVRDAVSKGAEILEGGRSVDPGTFFKPTVLECPTMAPRLFSEECFGPLLPLVKITSIEDAIEKAADTNYGLGLSVWTRDVQIVDKIAALSPVGMVWMNDVNVAYPQAPWGGRKNSGTGFELSEHSIRQYLVPKHVNYEESADVRRDWWYPY